jgi:nitroimidazol reductase NimA-like FMN-containing flavoprotein (pyridoxamine 5'-phosphate oxidase superfamily)
MLIEPLTDRECRELLARTNVARLACARNDQPYIVPIHVDYYDRALYGFSMLGQKIDWMRANPLVSVEVDELTMRHSWESVVIQGQYDELMDVPENVSARSVAERLFQRHPAWWEPATVPLAGRDARPPVLFRILINHMTGRRARPTDEEAAALSAAAAKSTRTRVMNRLVRGFRKG